MANDLTNNPLVIDTAGTLTTKPVQIAALYWAAGASGAAGDTCVVTNGSKTLWAPTIAAANATASISFDPPLSASGLAVSTLSHGTLFIYLRSGVPIT